jgi:hypothetical protein
MAVSSIYVSDMRNRRDLFTIPPSGSVYIGSRHLFHSELKNVIRLLFKQTRLQLDVFVMNCTGLYVSSLRALAIPENSVRKCHISQPSKFLAPSISAPRAASAAFKHSVDVSLYTIVLLLLLLLPVLRVLRSEL